MRFDVLKTRHGKLEEKIKHELLLKKPNLQVILKAIDDYEKDNLQTIEKLRKDKTIDTKKINGAIKQFLNAHPILTKELTGSLTKRIYGSLLSNEKPKKDKTLKSTIIGFVMGIIITLIIVLIN